MGDYGPTERIGPVVAWEGTEVEGVSPGCVVPDFEGDVGEVG